MTDRVGWKDIMTNHRQLEVTETTLCKIREAIGEQHPELAKIDWSMDAGTVSAAELVQRCREAIRIVHQVGSS